MNKKEVYQRMIDVYGEDYVIDKCIEEMSELTKELMKYRHKQIIDNHVCEEIAHVEFTVENVKLIFDENRIKEEKLLRMVKTKNKLIKKMEEK